MIAQGKRSAALGSTNKINFSLSSPNEERAGVRSREHKSKKIVCIS
jgi:hypothetical protein